MRVLVDKKQTCRKSKIIHIKKAQENNCKVEKREKITNYKNLQQAYMSEYCGTELKNKRTFFFYVSGYQMYNIQEDH